MLSAPQGMPVLEQDPAYGRHTLAHTQSVLGQRACAQAGRPLGQLTGYGMALTRKRAEEESAGRVGNSGS